MMDLDESVQTKGLGSSFRGLMYRVIASIRSLTLVTARRFSCLVVSSLKKRSTKFSHEAEVGVKWNCTRGCFSSQVRTAGCLCAA